MAAAEHTGLVLTQNIIGWCARIVAEVRGLPWMTGHVFPMMLPSTHRLPDSPIPRLRRSPTAAQARRSWRSAASVSSLLLYDHRINAFRRSLGLEPVRANVML